MSSIRKKKDQKSKTNTGQRDKQIKTIVKEMERLKKRKIPKIPASIIRYRKRFEKEKKSRLPEKSFTKIHVGTKNILNGKVLNYYSKKEINDNFCYALTGNYNRCKNKLSYICINMNEKGKRDKRKKLVPLCKLHSIYYFKNGKLPKGFYFECEKEVFKLIKTIKKNSKKN